MDLGFKTKKKGYIIGFNTIFDFGHNSILRNQLIR